MGMILACIDLEFFGHGITQRVLGKHALNCFFQRTTREASLHGLEIGLADATDVASMTVILATSVASARDRKSTRLNSSHVAISYAVFCLKKKNKNNTEMDT